MGLGVGYAWQEPGSFVECSYSVENAHPAGLLEGHTRPIWETMAKNFAVTVQASDGVVEAGLLARRLAQLVGHSEDEVEAALQTSMVIVQRELSYGEALEFQRELGRRRIPSQVRADVNLEGLELMREPSPEPDREIVAEEIFTDFEIEDLETDDLLGAVAVEEVAEEEVLGSAWGELFPDLDEGGEEVPEPVEESAVDLRSFGSGQGREVGDVAADLGQAPEIEPAGMAAEPVEHFEGRQIQDAFESVDDERPPFKPRGFDSGPVHIPLLAALLTAVAPGAGQIYNGQPEKAKKLAMMRFLLIKPWIDGVRQAWAYGEKVHTYYAPRPAEGAFKRAMIFAAQWWIAMVLLVGTSIWGLSSLQAYMERQAEQQRGLAVQQTIYFLEDVVADGLASAQEAAIEKAEQVEESSAAAGGMSNAERARRLFIIGYHYCLAQEYAMCAATMGRVTALSRDNRDAFRLQTWASVQKDGRGAESPMPEVGEVPTLEDFELELSLRGEDVDELLEAEWADGGEEGEGALIQIR